LGHAGPRAVQEGTEAGGWSRMLRRPNPLERQSFPRESGRWRGASVVREPGWRRPRKRLTSRRMRLQCAAPRTVRPPAAQRMQQMSEFKQTRTAPAEGKRAGLVPGEAAVATTPLAGVGAGARGRGT